MARLLTAVMIATPGTALAHGLPFAHAHPHGVETVLGGFALVAAATYATWRLHAWRRRRDRDE